jgi:predicted ribosome quality control (RQC) complex YloA/Tae2 family protein
MQIELDPSKSPEQNAVAYYEEAKKFKRKAEEARKAIELVKKKLVEEKKVAEKKRKELAGKEEKRITVKEPVKKEWFEKFHYFVTSEGLLVLGGRDAKQNEVLVAKHLEKNDLFFHADIQGASAVVLKCGGKEVGEQSKREAAQFSACYSKAWTLGYGSIDVYAVSGAQVSKAAPSGEYVPKGGFMIYGKKEWFRNTPLKLIVGLIGLDEKKKKLVALPELIKEKPEKFVEIVPGEEEKRKAAEKVAARLGLEKEKLDELMQLIPGKARLLN